MDIMREYQIPVPRGFMATDAAQAESLYKAEIGTEVPVVVKAMVLAGNFILYLHCLQEFRCDEDYLLDEDVQYNLRICSQSEFFVAVSFCLLVRVKPYNAFHAGFIELT